MIEIEVKKHDNFSVEFKTSFITEKKIKNTNDFKINTWVFIPNSLDINRSTYPKELFYKDVKTNLRLITPVYYLDEILSSKEQPMARFKIGCKKLIQNPESKEAKDNFSYSTKMLLCIIKSALRRHMITIKEAKNEEEVIEFTERFVSEIRIICKEYREEWVKINRSEIEQRTKNYYLFGDNFLGNIIEQYSFKVLRLYEKERVFDFIKPLIIKLIEEEIEYRKNRGFLLLEKGNHEQNSLVILERNALKKFIESDLFLHTVKKKDGVYAEQFYYSIAAGIAMIFATVISFFAQRRFGSLTADLFIILIVSYMLKDRIKDFMRYYFTSKLSKKYFDLKLKLSIRNQEIGFIKEAFDFIEEEKLPDSIIAMRNRTPLVEAENQTYDEKIMIYRKWVNLSKNDMKKYKEYRLAGINDITRFNLINFVQKMDNPSLPLYIPNEEKGYTTMQGTRVYPLYFILQCETETTTYFKKYRFMFNREGITSIHEFDMK